MIKLIESDYGDKIQKASDIQTVYLKHAKSKAKLRKVKFNGKDATIEFLEYEAPEKDIPLWQEETGTDGHFYYITARTTYFDNYWQQTRNIKWIFVTDKETGNEVYKEIKSTGEFNLDC